MISAMQLRKAARKILLISTVSFILSVREVFLGVVHTIQKDASSGVSPDARTFDRGSIASKVKIVLFVQQVEDG